MKQAGLALPDPTKTACVITGHIVADIRGNVEFQMVDHLACLQVGQMAVRKRSVLRAEEALEETIARDPLQGAR